MMSNDNIIPPQPVMENPPPPPQKRVLGLRATIGFGLLVIIVFFVVQAVVVGVALVIAAYPEIRAALGTSQIDQMTQQLMDIMNSRLGLLQSIATIVSGITGVGLILIIIKSQRRAGIAEYLGLNKLTWRSALTSVGAVVLFLVIADVIQNLLGNQTNEQITYDIYNTSISPVLFGIAVVIFAPLFEEVFFRGFLYEGFRQSSLGAVGAIIITSIVFSLAHSFQYSVGSVLWILALGLVMGIVRWKTKTLWSTFIMHAIVNLVATIGIAFNLNI